MYQTTLDMAEEQKQLLEIIISEKQVCLHWQGEDILLNRSRAIRYLIELLMHPYQSISAPSLYAICNYDPALITQEQVIGNDEGISARGFHSILPNTKYDAQAIRDIRKRLNQLSRAMTEAEQWCDLKRFEETKEEYESLVDYLKEAIYEHKKRFVYSDTDMKYIENIYHSLIYILRVIAHHSVSLHSLLQKSLRLWAELMFIPEDGLTVTVVDN
jgi:hypothetical protein